MQEGKFIPTPMKITLKTLPPEMMRYPTTGDWQWFDNGDLLVTVAEHKKHDRSAFLVMLHELVEAFLCKDAGISEEDVSAFDLSNPDLPEPGEHPDAPYRRQHEVAIEVEKIVASALLRDWDDHEDWVQAAGDAVEAALTK